MTCDESRERFVDALFGTRDNELEGHLATCAACTAEFAALKETLALMRTREKIGGPDEGFWERLAPKLGSPPVGLDGHGSRFMARTPAWRPAALPAWAYGIAAVLLLSAGIYLGRRYFAPPAATESPVTATREPAPGAGSIAEQPHGAGTTARNEENNAANAVGSQAGRLAHGSPRRAAPSDTLDARALAYLDKTKNLLLGVVNAEEEQPAQLARTQEMSRKLVRQSRYLQAALTEPDQQQMKRLILELEVILLQLANVETAPGTPAVELVRQGVDKKSILLKINLEEMRAAASRSKQERKHTI